jgi:hypothetical protein
MLQEIKDIGSDSFDELALSQAQAYLFDIKSKDNNAVISLKKKHKSWPSLQLKI